MQALVSGKYKERAGSCIFACNWGGGTSQRREEKELSAAVGVKGRGEGWVMMVLVNARRGLVIARGGGCSL
jgi:hypothetical protein